MSQEKIGLVEFINQVKIELLAPNKPGDPPPFFTIDTIELEMTVGVTKTGKAGLTIQVLELGGEISSENTQKVTVTLTPVLDRETRLKMMTGDLTERDRQLISKATVKGNKTALKNQD